MTFDARPPALPLPAPTEFQSDVATNLSTRTDKTTYSIPDDGREVHILKPRGHSSMSQASLLIEYYEGGKSSKAGGTGRSSVRVKIRPSSKSGTTNMNDSLKITKMVGEHDRPVYTKRIPLDGTDTNVQLGTTSSPLARQDLEAQAVGGSELTQSSASGRGPVDIEIMKNSSDMSSGYRVVQHNASEVSSMPADSLLDAPLTFKSPQRRRSQSLEREAGPQSDLLKAPVDVRSRSLSRERIAQRVIEKLNADKDRDSTGRRRLQKVRDKGGRELVDADLKARSRRSSKSHNDSDLRSATDGSSLRPRDGDSNISGASKSSVNNPKVIQAVEDAIRRLILPEIESIKRNQSLNQRRNRDSFASESSRTDASRRDSRASIGTSKIKLTGEALLAEADRRKARRRESRTDSERSMDTIDREKRRERERERSSRHSTRDRIAEGLTAEALKTHDTRDRDLEERERRKRRSKHESLATSEGDYLETAPIPPMPMRSELMDSELTRESILSAETADDDDARTERPDEHHPKTPLREVARGNAALVPLPVSRSASRTPAAVPLPDSRPTTRQAITRGSSTTPTPAGRDGRMASAESVKTQMSIKSKARNAGLAAAGLGGAAVAAMYEHEHHKDDGGRTTHSRQSNASRQSDRTNRRSSAGTVVRDVLATDTFSPKLEEHPHGHLHDNIPHRANEGSYFASQYTTTDPAAFDGTHEAQRNVSEHDRLAEVRRLERSEPRDISSSNQYANEGHLNDNNDSFYEQQRRINDTLRSSPGHDDSQHFSSTFDTNDSIAENAEKSLKNASANAHVVHNVVDVESGVASLLEPSMISEQSGTNSTRQTGLHSNDASPISQATPTKSIGMLGTEHDNNSRNRWSLLRESAKALSAGNSRENSPEKPRTPLGGKSDTSLAYSGDHSSPRPLLERGMHSDESIRNIEPVKHVQSWPYSSDPQAHQQLRAAGHDEFESPDITPQEEHHHGREPPFVRQASDDSVHDSDTRDISHLDIEESAQQLKHHHDGSADYKPHSHNRNATFESPTISKDEGYMSAAHNLSNDNFTPLSYSKPAPRLFDDVDLKRGSPGYLKAGHTLQNVRDERARNVAPELPDIGEAAYNPATGEGAEHIKSRDIINLMDHLSARDGQRSARDMEILTTLVRSAAEMRGAFDDMKKFIEYQNNINMQRTDKDAEVTVNKILSGPRPPPPSNSVYKSRPEIEEPVKKGNIFKRAIKGLSGKSQTDLTHIEDMLNQLLDEVEALREGQAPQSLPQSTPWPAKPKPSSMLNSYENLRLAPIGMSAYQAGETTPTQSRHNLASPTFEQPRSTDKYTSPARDEINDDGIRTPTQERPDPLNSHRVQQDYGYGAGINPALSTEEKQRKHASNASSMFVPQVSRWSKTTASTSQDVGVHSRSLSSDFDTTMHQQGLFNPADVDRLRSPIMPRSPSPLVPSISSPKVSPAPDPKYRANRNSLILEHPQPRQGSTDRHQSHLENEATTYEPSEGSPVVHQSDIFGSSPNLNRRYAGLAVEGNSMATVSPPIATYPGRFAGVNLEAQHPANSYSPVSAHNEGPLIPQALRLSKVEHPLAQSAYPYEDPLIKDSYQAYRNAHSPASSCMTQEEWLDTRVPPEEEPGKYQPGELLNPIEERYSLEGDRSSIHHRNSVKSNRGKRNSLHEAQMSGDHGSRRASQVGMADVREEDEDDYTAHLAQQQILQAVQPKMLDTNERINTPRLSPRPAIGGGDVAARKLTGPREMPGMGSPRGSPRMQVASPKMGGARMAASVVPSSGLRGTLTRKPVR